MPGGRSGTRAGGGVAGRLMLLAALVVAAALGGGCDKPKAKKKAASVVVSIDTLPATDPDSAITVDEGRLEVVSPAGWTRAPRSADCLVRYVPGAQKTYPSIVVMAGDPPAEIVEVTAENQKAFVAAVAADLAATFSRDGKSTLLKKPVAITLGERRGVTWAAPATAKVEGMKEQIERECIAVIVGGRLVTVEARAPNGKLDDAGRAAARAVAAAVRPVETAAATEGDPAPEPPAAPAEAAPDDGSPPRTDPPANG